MRDSRLQQAMALLDDARELLVDLVDEGPKDGATLRDFNQLDSARLSINIAIQHVQYATDPEPAA